MGRAAFAVDVLCLGIACYDLIFSVDRHIGADEKIKATGLTSCGGGIAANASMTVARPRILRGLRRLSGPRYVRRQTSR